MEHAGYIFAAFAAVWAAVFGYILVLLLKEGKIRRDIDALKAQLEEKDK